MNRPARIFLKPILILLLIVHSSRIFGEASALKIQVSNPVTSDFTICSPSFVSLVATGSTGFYRWYNASQGGSFVLNPSRVFVDRNKTFYVSALQWVDNKYVESERVPLNINITGAIAAPRVDTLRICGSSNDYMYASGARSNEQYKWYADSTSASAIKISLDENDVTFYAYMDSRAHYYVSIADRSGVCESKRVRVPILIKPVPSAPVVRSEPVVCGSGPARLEVEKEPGFMYHWYPCQNQCSYFMNRSGTEQLDSENYLDTYLYNYGGISSYTVWVEKISLDNFCAGERIPLTATTYKSPAPVVTHDVYQCRKDIKTITASIPGGQSELATVNWYSDVEKTQLLMQGTSYTIPATLTKKTKVYAVVKDPLFNNCESEALEGEVIIHPKELPPSPGISVYENCGEVVFHVQETAPGMEYLWYTSDTLHAVHTGRQLTNYSNSTYTSDAFYVAAVTEEGCMSKKIRTEGRALGILPGPPISSVERCGEGSVKLKIEGNSKYNRYRWYDYNGNAIIGEYDSEYTSPYLYASTSYLVSMMGENGCESEKRSVNVLLRPGVSVRASNEFVCRGETVALYGTGGNYYLWSENGINLSNWSTIYVNPSMTSTYTLTDPTIAGPCRSASITVRVNKNTECGALAVDSLYEEGKISSYPIEKARGKVFPNPFTHEFSVDPSVSGEYRIYDLMGNELFYFPSSFSGKTIHPSLPSGSYILEIRGENQQYREKIIKL